MEITGRTRLIGILGYPVSHSLSPRMQNAAFDAMNLDIRYVPLAVRPDDLSEAVAGLKALNFLGANVTIPHKVPAARLVDRLEGTAYITGAVNTIVNQDGNLIGYNTDGIGFIRSLEEVKKLDYSNASVFMLGAGGAARSVAVALAEKGINNLAIVNRTRARAAELAELLSRNFPDMTVEIRTPEESNEDLVEASRLVINATSVGLEGDLKMPYLPVDKLTKDHVVCDIVYTQSQDTPLLSAARGKGASTLGGLGMLLHQGVAAIHLWTGVDPPIEVMREAIEPGRIDIQADSQKAAADRRDPGSQGSHHP